MIAKRAEVKGAEAGYQQPILFKPSGDPAHHRWEIVNVLERIFGNCDVEFLFNGFDASTLELND